jgi:hypothetical protein
VFYRASYFANSFGLILMSFDFIFRSNLILLKVVEEHQDVKKFMVSDFSNVGFPQLGIWMNDAKESLTPNKIVEFNEGQNTWSDDSSISNILHEKYQVGML